MLELTALGYATVFGSIAFVVPLGVALFVYSNPVLYLTTYWLFLTITPPIILSVVNDQTNDVCTRNGYVAPCTGWHYILFFITMFVLAFICIPVAGAALRVLWKRPVPRSNPAIESDSLDQ